MPFNRRSRSTSRKRRLGFTPELPASLKKMTSKLNKSAPKSKPKAPTQAPAQKKYKIDRNSLSTTNKQKAAVKKYNKTKAPSSARKTMKPTFGKSKFSAPKPKAKTQPKKKTSMYDRMLAGATKIKKSTQAKERGKPKSKPKRKLRSWFRRRR